MGQQNEAWVVAVRRRLLAERGSALENRKDRSFTGQQSESSGQDGGGVIALGGEFGRVEFNEKLAGFESVAFLGVEFDDATTVAGGDVDFVGFNRAGNSRGRLAAARRTGNRAARTA